MMMHDDAFISVIDEMRERGILFHVDTHMFYLPFLWV